jgi:hypothetical protein
MKHIFAYTSSKNDVAPTLPSKLQVQSVQSVIHETRNAATRKVIKRQQIHSTHNNDDIHNVHNLQNLFSTEQRSRSSPHTKPTSNHNPHLVNTDSAAAEDAMARASASHTQHLYNNRTVPMIVPGTQNIACPYSITRADEDLFTGKGNDMHDHTHPYTSFIQRSKIPSGSLQAQNTHKNGIRIHTQIQLHDNRPPSLLLQSTQPRRYAKPQQTTDAHFFGSSTALGNGTRKTKRFKSPTFTCRGRAVFTSSADRRQQTNNKHTTDYRDPRINQHQSSRTPSTDDGLAK